MSELSALLDQAFRQGPAHQANQLIADVRAETLAQAGAAANYEVPLLRFDNDDRAAWTHLCDHVAPRLSLYLEDKKIAARDNSVVFLSIFWGATVYFVRSPVFYAAVDQ